MAEQQATGGQHRCNTCGETFRTEGEGHMHEKECKGARSQTDPTRMRTQEQNKVTSKE